MDTHGFILMKERELTEVGGVVKLWRHDKTGAQLLSVTNEDENKCFGANFFTPPDNSTGVAHVLEHSVLCGSKKYPVKEPFAELLKGSLQTFLNAFTFPDKTCYPVASANLRDFYNLVAVYLDAVYHPLLTKDIFRQEGWSVVAETADGPWTFKGVVYNEMKGVYSSPDSVLAESSQQAVFPDNIYRWDSGGKPDAIPDLTYEAFADFHSRFYQPGNTRFFFWGDDPEEERLKILSETLAGYGPLDNLPEVKLQKPFAEPRYREIPYACAEGEERALVTVNWLLAERGNVLEAMKAEALEHILEGLPGSPLRAALLESGLGEDMAGAGLETDLRQMYYSSGLKGIKPADAGKVEDLIMKVMRDLAENGVPREAAAAAMNTVEFAYRESNSGRFPRGLSAMLMALSTWLYGGDPFSPLAWEEPLAKIKKDLADGKKVFEEAIRDNFLNNPHRVRVTLLPDPKLGRVRDDAEKSRLAAMREETSAEKRVRVVNETKRLKEAQLKPDSPEALATIPALTVADLPKKNAEIPVIESAVPQTFLAVEQPTRGVAYVNLCLPIKRLPVALAPYLPLFSRSLLDFGTARRDYVSLGALVASTLGGFSVAPMIGTKIGDRSAYCYLNAGGKATYENIPRLFDVAREILLEPQENREIILSRLKQMIPEEKARLEHSLQAAGHSAVGIRLRARYTGAGALGEQTAGVSQLEFLRELQKKLETEPEKIISDFSELRSLIVSSQDVIFNCVAEAGAMAALEKGAVALANALPAEPRLVEGAVLASYAPLDFPAGEAFITPSQVNYVGKAANLYDLGYQYDGAANVIMRWLRMGRLWEDVRVAGGAYGVFCGLDRATGTAVFASYRDPNIDRTLSAYDAAGSWLRGFKPTPAQIEQAIVGAIGDMDAYMLPDAKGATSLARRLSGLTDETRQKTRDEIFAVTGKDFNDFADVMDAAAQAGAVCVLGGESARAEATARGWSVKNLV